MSASEDFTAAGDISPNLHEAARQIRATADAIEEPNGDQRSFTGSIPALLGHAARLYTAYVQRPYGHQALRALDVTQTEACTAAAALLHSQALSPFEFAIWFSSARMEGQADGDPS